MKTKHIIVIAVAIVLILLLISKCNCRKENTIASVSFVNPPIKSADVPYKNYTVQAEKGDTLIYSSGSVIVFPSNSFVDEKGNLVKGNVDVSYREFKDPVDFFLSGISMNYDSAGVKYVFESAGMSDIKASQNGVPVFVNRNRKPEINIASKNNNVAQNLYYLDTVNRKWINMGKSEILEKTNRAENKSVDNNSVSISDIPKPVKPKLADENLPIIKVIIDSASFKELMVYNNLRFQLDKDEKSFEPEDSYRRWDDIKLIKRKQEGVYNLRFTNTRKTVEYKVHPVLDEKDYAEAMITFDKQMRIYEKKIEKRLEEFEENKKQHLKDSANDRMIDEENEKTAKLNALIEAKNAEVEKENKIIEAENNNIYSINSENRLMRGFNIDNFGIWNCDQPFIRTATVKVDPKFVDEDNNALEMKYANIFMKDFNSIVSIESGLISIPEKTSIMIIGVSKGRLSYITYDEIEKLNITENTKTQVFPMHVVSEEHNNYAFIRSILGV